MAPTRLAVLGLLAAAPVAALRHTAARDDGLDELEKPLQPKDPKCQCLPFVDVYTKYSVRCGDGHGMERHGVEDCEFFYPRIPEGLCWNIPTEKEDKGQWCYVSMECEKLNGGARVGKAPVQWKKCEQKDQDPMTRFWKVRRLSAWAKHFDMDMAQVFSNAYPSLRYPWEKLRPKIEPGHKYNLTNVPSPWGPWLQEYMNNHEKVFIPSDLKEHGVIDGFKTYVLQENGEWARGKAWHDKLQHPYKNTLVKLIKEA